MKGERVWWRRLESGLLIVGLILTGSFLIVTVHGRISAHRALRKFEASRREAHFRLEESVKPRTGEQVDFSLWSNKRIQEYMESLVTKAEMPSAVLRIPKLRLEVPVYDGTDDLTLNRGVGRVIGTTRLGGAGNIGIAGHRDGFFRGLKDIVSGDTIELMLPNRVDQYVVETIQITTPEDVGVLQPTAKPCLTLVTCYPFYFVGRAPQRYIVQAFSINPDQSRTPAVTCNRGTTSKTKEKPK
jgi:sortase A